MIHDDVQQFLDAISETTKLWDSVDVRVMAGAVHGVWHNLVSRVQLKPISPGDVPRPTDFPHLPYFTVLQEVYPLTELPRLVNDIRAGTLEIQGQRVNYLTAGSEDNSFVSPYTSSFALIGRDLREHMRGAFRYGHSLTLSADEAGAVFRLLPRKEEGLNTALRSLPDPWGGVSDVLLHALEDPSTLHDQARRRVTLIAPIEARLDPAECLLVDEVLAFSVRAKSRRIGESCTVVVTGIDSAGRRIARRLPLSSDGWVQDEDGFQYAGTEPLPHAKRLILTLQVAGYELGETEVKARNEKLPLLLSAYQALFPNQRNFAQALLEPVKTQARTFEQHVALLFTYCGMPVEYIGDTPQTQDAPDLLVQLSGTTIVLVVEVTVASINHNGKLAKLTQRAEQIRPIVEACGGQVMPVMVTANLQHQIAQNELDAASTDGVRVLSRNDLATLLEMAVARAPSSHIAKYIAPELIRRSLPPLWGMRERNPYLADEELG